MKQTYFKRMPCTLCGRKATMKFIRGRLKKAPHRKSWICIIHCPHCEPRAMELAASKESAKEQAVDEWNETQILNIICKHGALKSIWI